VCGDGSGKPPKRHVESCPYIPYFEASKAAKELGQLGGRKTAQSHGKQHFSEAGKKGAAKRWGKEKPSAT